MHLLFNQWATSGQLGGLHTLVFHCPTTKKIIQEFFDKYMTIQVPECEEFFGANLGDNEENNNCFQLVMDILRFYLWQAKLEEKNCQAKQMFSKM